VENPNLIQEEYKEDPWKVLVCCILLNQTHNRQVRPLIRDFFKRWPDSRSVIKEDTLVIRDHIRSTGFQNIKAKRIQDFSKAWDLGIRDPMLLPGVGKYGRDAWRIFIKKEYDFLPDDKKLRLHLEYISGEKPHYVPSIRTSISE